jgi:hypothetical protein
VAKEPERHSISIDRGGKTHHGSYYVSGGMVHVFSLLGSKTTQVGGSPAESMARILLGEIVDQNPE